MIFKDEYFFLSTFYDCEIIMNIENKECRFRNLESAFQAQRNPATADKYYKIKGLEAKNMAADGLLKTVIPDWNHYQLIAMAKALNAKFQNKALLLMLKCIKEDIVNETYWHDTFWGIDKKTKEGKNILGKMLTIVRDTDNDLNALLSYAKNEAQTY